MTEGNKIKNPVCGPATSKQNITSHSKLPKNMRQFANTKCDIIFSCPQTIVRFNYAMAAVRAAVQSQIRTLLTCTVYEMLSVPHDCSIRSR